MNDDRVIGHPIAGNPPIRVGQVRRSDGLPGVVIVSRDFTRPGGDGRDEFRDVWVRRRAWGENSGKQMTRPTGGSYCLNRTHRILYSCLNLS